MSERIDKYSGSVLKRLLEGMQEMKVDMEEKQYNKHWKEIKIPFTLHEGLSSYTKDELVDIRSYLEINNASSLKKAELINLLEEVIPVKLESICNLLDKERFKLLTDIVAAGGFLVTSDEEIEVEQIKYFHKTGLIYTGTYKEKQVLAVPEDLIDPILSLKNNLTVRANIKRNTELITLTRGLLYYYGTLNSPKLVDMLEAYRRYD